MSVLGWPLLLLAFGLILLVSEVFIPSGGLIGLLAVGCVGLSLWQAFQHSYDLGLKFLLADFVLLPMAGTLAIYLWPRTPLARRVFLRPPDPGEMDVSHSDQRIDHLIGQYGRALTPLRPSGMVDFDGRRLDGLAEEGLIPSGALIRAVRVRAGQLVVRTEPDQTIDELLIESDLTPPRGDPRAETAGPASTPPVTAHPERHPHDPLAVRAGQRRD